MSTTSPDNRITTYNPVVPTTEFAALFPVFDLADIIVYVDGIQRFDFTVSGTFDQGISTDAKAVFPIGITGQVDVVGSRRPRRTSRFTNGVPLPIWAQNLALDALEAEMQETDRDTRRAHRAPYGEEGGVFNAADIQNAQANAAAAAESAAAAATFNRNHPTLLLIAAALGLTEEQVDAMWLEAVAA